MTKFRIVVASLHRDGPALNHFLKFQGIGFCPVRIWRNICSQLICAHRRSLFRFFFHGSSNCFQSQGKYKNGEDFRPPRSLQSD